MYLIKSKQVFKPKRKTKITVNKLSLKEISKVVETKEKSSTAKTKWLRQQYHYHDLGLS